MAEAIPISVQILLREQIQSIAQLEMLLRLREPPAAPENVPELSAKLYIPDSMTLSLLEGLKASGLVDRVDGSEPLYQYAPKSPELAQAVDQLDQLYQQRRVTIINLIYSNPVKKLQDFADAFRIRKQEEK
jgi:DNA-binding IclR family transcriptional regulator